MFKVLSRFACVLSTVLISAAVLVSGAANAATVAFSGIPTEVEVGETFSIDILATGFAGPATLTNYAISSWVPTLLELQSFTSFGQLSPNTSSTDPLPVTDGVFTAKENTTDPSALQSVQPDDFTIATLTFAAIAPGVLNLGGFKIPGGVPDPGNDTIFGLRWAGSGCVVCPPTTKADRISFLGGVTPAPGTTLTIVTPISLPAAALLLLSALGVLACFRRMRST